MQVRYNYDMDLKAAAACVLLKWAVATSECAAIIGPYAGGSNESNLAAND